MAFVTTGAQSSFRHWLVAPKVDGWAGHRFDPSREMIRPMVLMCVRFSLPLRNVENLLSKLRIGMESIALGWPDDNFPANVVGSERRAVHDAAVFVGFSDQAAWLARQRRRRTP